MARTAAVLAVSAIATVALVGVPVGGLGHTPDDEQPINLSQLTHSATSDRLDYSTLAGGDVSPGLYWPNGSLEPPVIRVFRDVDLAQIEREHADLHPEVVFEPSRYTLAELTELNELIRTIPLEGSEAFGAHYLADVDSYRIGGNVPAEKLEAALDGHDYSFEFSADAGRATR